MQTIMERRAKRTRRAVGAVLAAALAAVALAACGGSSGGSGGSGGGGGADGGGSGPTHHLKVAYVFNAQPDDASYNQAAYGDLLAVKKHFASRISVSYKASIEPGSAATQAVGSLIAAGNNLIIAPATGNLPYIQSLLTAHPDVRYEGFLDSRPQGTPKNFGVWSIEPVGGTYLLGMMMAAASKTNLIGFVGSFPIPGIKSQANGLLLGARAIKPHMKLRVVYVNSFYDPAKEAVAAKALIAAGAGALYTSNTDNATGATAEAAGVPFTTLSLFNGAKAGPKEYLNSIYFNSTAVETRFVADTLAGKTLPDSLILGGFADGSLTLGQPGPAYDRLVNAAARKKIAARLAELKAGKFNPYTGPISDQSGKVVLPAGKTLSIQQSSTISWLANGVTAGS